MIIGSDKMHMLQRALTWMVCDLQYARHQARRHGCNVEQYDKEIEDYKQLKEEIWNEYIQDKRTQDRKALKVH